MAAVSAGGGLMAWVQIGNSLLNLRHLDDAMHVTLGMLVEGRWTLVVLFRDGRIINIGDFERLDEARSALSQLLQALQSTQPQL